MILVITFCIGIHLLLLVCRPKCLNSNIEEEKLRRYRRLDLGYIIYPLVIPVLFILWPWINSCYGDAGDWCWIEAWDESCNHVIDGFLEQILLWYMWVLLLMAFTTVATAITSSCLLCYMYYKRKNNELDQKGLCDVKICTLLIYLVLCLVVNVIGLADRAIQWQESRLPYPLLISHSIVYPSWGILSATVVYVVVCSSWKKGTSITNPKQKVRKMKK